MKKCAGAEQMTMFGPDTEYGRMYPEHLAAATPKARTSASSLKSLSELRTAPYQCLDLRAGAGSLLGPFWEINAPWLGEYTTLNTGPAPHSGAAGSTLSQILEATPHPKYYLSSTACLGILRRAEKRGKALPPQLKTALEIQGAVDMRELGALSDMEQGMVVAGLITKGNGECILTPESHTSLTSGGGQAGQGYPCVLTAGFCGKAGAKARDIGFEEERSPTLTSNIPSILCLCDQGGQRMDLYENMTGTLRSQMDGHPPLVAQPKTFCLAGNSIDRQPQNGGNGLGCQEDISYTITAADKHAVFSQQRSDEYIENAVASAQSARQHKDATDLIYQKTVGTLVASDKNGPNNQYVGDDKCIIMPANFIRRLTPLECERLQGFPDFWTDIPADGHRPGASDSARYKALGNSVAIPCVEHVLRGVSYFLKQFGGEHHA